MKQHISIDQLNELSPEALARLTTWFNRDPITKKPVPKEYEWGISCTQVTIGQMIEILLHETNFNLDYSDSDGTWGVQLGEKEHGNSELCDALWEAVKAVLEDTNA